MSNVCLDFILGQSEQKGDQNSCKAKYLNQNLDPQDILLLGLRRVIKLQPLSHQTNQTSLMDQNKLIKLYIQTKNLQNGDLRT